MQQLSRVGRQGPAKNETLAQQVWCHQVAPNPQLHTPAQVREMGTIPLKRHRLGEDDDDGTPFPIGADGWGTVWVFNWGKRGEVYIISPAVPGVCFGAGVDMEDFYGGHLSKINEGYNT